MVNKIISRYCSSPPSDFNEDTDRLIATGPLYPDILSALERCDIRPATQRCISDMAFYGISGDDIRKWMKSAVSSGGYINSMWCRLSPNRNCIVACDAYRVLVDICNPITDELEAVPMYLKLCISKTGSTVMQISAHPSNFTD
ncbi:hypothetical protein AM438_00055 [Proteus mirabilis]|nr:hypothetical protein AM438_00055 [Proteus mirabilis]HAU5758979.1 hypothetical protein [Proteus mirabilis]